jgi:hypothetical protein
MILNGEVSIADDTIQSVGISIGTSGTKLEYSGMIYADYNMSFRVSVGGISWNGSYEEQNEDGSANALYDTDLKIFNVGVTFEYHPFNNGFYMGAGAFMQDNDLSFEAKPSDGYLTFNGHNYLEDIYGSVSGKIYGLNKVVPYIGIGYDASLYESGNLFFTFKAGAWYQNAPKIALSAHDCILEYLPGSFIDCNTLRYDLDQEEEDINEELKGYKWWPVIHIGVSYRF